MTPDFLNAVADEGEITKELAESLKMAYLSFNSNVCEIESLRRTLKKLPRRGNSRLYGTTYAIATFFIQISDDMENRNTDIMELDDRQIEKLKILQALSNSWNTISMK